MANQHTGSIWADCPEAIDIMLHLYKQYESWTEVAKRLREIFNEPRFSDNAVKNKGKRILDGAEVENNSTAKNKVSKIMGDLSPEEMAEVRRAVMEKNDEEEKSIYRVPGELKAPPRYLASRQDNKPYRVVFISDVHVPFHHEEAVLNTTRFIDDINPDLVILGGDIWDAAALCQYPVQSRREDRRYDLGEEIKMSRSFLQAWISSAKEVVYIGGNHDIDRKERLLANGAKGLSYETNTIWHMTNHFDIKGLKFAEFNEFKGEMLMVGTGKSEVGFKHGHIYPMHTAWKNLTTEHPGVHTCQAHTHRPEIKTWKSVTANVNGHMMVEQRYMKNAKWTESFTVYEFYDNGSKYNLSPVLIHNDGSFAYGGRIYS